MFCFDQRSENHILKNSLLVLNGYTNSKETKFEESFLGRPGINIFFVNDTSAKIARFFDVRQKMQRDTTT